MISLNNVRKVFQGSHGQDVVAVDEVSLTVDSGQTLCLIGTSGSGKTTCLKMINRLIEPTSGTLMVGGEDILSVDPIRLRRSIGYVVQKSGLLPHLTVGENIGLLCRLEKWSAKRTQEQIHRLLDLVNLEPETYQHRYPLELSGGQQQRVGVARALALDPEHILMDEPFGALDPITRESLHEEFLRLKQEVKKTIVIVTHDLAEAFKLGDQVALLDHGRLVQKGTQDDFTRRPVNPFAKDFVKAHLAGGTLTVSDALESSPSPPEGEPLAWELPLKEALLKMTSSERDTVPVVGKAGEHLGVVTVAGLLERLP